MPDVWGLLMALIAGGLLKTAGDVFLGRAKAKADTDSTNTTNLIKQLEWHTKEIDRMREENSGLRTANEKLHKDLHDERENCSKEIKKMKAEMEKMNETISTLRMEINTLKSKT